jgi:hypothetical protein
MNAALNEVDEPQKGGDHQAKPIPHLTVEVVGRQQ